MKRYKKLFCCLILYIPLQYSFAQSGIRFAETGLAKALQQAKLQHKPVCFMCYASWCPHCNFMKKNIFTDPAVADFFNSYFVCVAQDMEKGDGVELHKRWDIKSYPTFLFFDENDSLLYRTTGEFKADEFIWEGKGALDPQRHLSYLKKQFENNPADPDKCYDYLRTLRKAELDCSDMVKKYFATQTDQQLLSEVNWRIISNGIHDLDAKEFRFVLSHQQEYGRLASPERVEKKIIYTVREVLGPLVDNNDTTGYYTKREQASAIHLSKVDSLLFVYDLMLYEKNNNWNAYKQTASQGVEKYAWASYTQLNSVAGNYLKQISDATSLTQAVKWVQHSLAIHEEYGTYILCAKLLVKQGNRPQGAQMAQQAKDLAAKYNWDHAEADELLNELKKKPAVKRN